MPYLNLGVQMVVRGLRNNDINEQRLLGLPIRFCVLLYVFLIRLFNQRSKFKTAENGRERLLSVEYYQKATKPSLAIVWFGNGVGPNPSP